MLAANFTYRKNVKYVSREVGRMTHHNRLGIAFDCFFDIACVKPSLFVERNNGVISPSENGTQNAVVFRRRNYDVTFEGGNRNVECRSRVLSESDVQRIV